MKIAKIMIVSGLILIPHIIFSIEISGPGEGKIEQGTAENIYGFLNTAFGGLFPSEDNILLRDFAPNTQYVKDALEKWNKRVDEWKNITSNLDIAQNLKSAYQQHITRLKKVNDDIIRDLAYNFKNKIYPAIKKPGKYQWKVDEIDYNLINKDTLHDIPAIITTSSAIINDIKKKLESNKPSRYQRQTKKAYDLIQVFIGFLETMIKQIDKGYQEILLILDLKQKQEEATVKPQPAPAA